MKVIELEWLTELWNMSPSWQEVSEHYYAARNMFKRVGGFDTQEGVARMQAFNRKVHIEFHRRLKAAGIYVEGA